MKRDRYVYALFAGEQRVPCYIGVGKLERMHRHMRDARRGYVGNNPRKCRTLIACLRRGIVVVPVKVASNLTVGEAYAVETALVEFYGRRGAGGCLLNAAKGGFGGRDPLPSTREKIRLARVGAKTPEETRARCAAAQRGRKHSEETKKKISAANSGPGNAMWGKRHSAEHKEHISRLTSGENNPMFGRPSARKGVVVSEETKERMRAARKAWWGKQKLKEMRL